MSWCHILKEGVVLSHPTSTPPPHCTLFRLPWPVSLHWNFEFQDPNAQSICPLLINVALAWIFTFSKYFLCNSLTCDWSIVAADSPEKVLVLILWLVESFVEQEMNRVETPWDGAPGVGNGFPIVSSRVRRGILDSLGFSIPVDSAFLVSGTYSNRWRDSGFLELNSGFQSLWVKALRSFSKLYKAKVPC